METNFNYQKVYDLAIKLVPKGIQAEIHSELSSKLENLNKIKIPYNIPSDSPLGTIDIPTLEAMSEMPLGHIFSPGQKELTDNERETLKAISRNREAQILFALFYASNKENAYADRNAQEKHNALQARLEKEAEKEQETFKKTENRQKLYERVEEEFYTISQNKDMENFSEEFIELYFLAAKNIHGTNNVKMTRNKQTPKFHIEVAEPQKKYLRTALKTVLDEAKNNKAPKTERVETNLDYRIKACKLAFEAEVQEERGLAIKTTAKIAALAGILEYMRQEYGQNFSRENPNPFDARIREAVEKREIELAREYFKTMKESADEREAQVRKELSEQIKNAKPEDYDAIKAKLANYERYFDQKIESRKNDKQEFKEAADSFSTSPSNPAMEKLARMVKEHKPETPKPSIFKKIKQYWGLSS